MPSGQDEWSRSVAHTLALAAQLEGSGQYNIAKLLRAAVDSLERQAAYRVSVPSGADDLVGEIDRAAASLAGLGVSADLVAALRRGRAALADGRLPLIDETPHPYVCRTCGYLVLAYPEQNCPTCNAYHSTFRRFMPVYWLDHLEPPAVLESLAQTPERVSALLDGLIEAQLTHQPESGGWSLYQTLSHLRDAQGVLEMRLNLMLEQDNPALESLAVFEWASREQERPPTTQEVFDAYRASRQRTIDSLAAIPPESWWRTGRHQEFGTVTIRQQASYFASHEITHLPQMASLREQVTGAG